jgi:hypothetical protein
LLTECAAKLVPQRDIFGAKTSDVLPTGVETLAE